MATTGEAAGDAGVFLEALKIWEATTLRNPKMARFGNQNARKRRGHETRTELPPEPCNDQPEQSLEGLGEGDSGASAFELDEDADNDEATEENVFASEQFGGGASQSTLAIVPAFRAPEGFVVDPPAVEVSHATALVLP